MAAEHQGPSSPPSSPWWLGGHETCGFCLQHYALEMEARCAHCDRPLCALCGVATETGGLLLCPECVDTEGSATDTGESQGG
jgi:hypothetical protein